MAFDRPTLSEIKGRVNADIVSEVGQQLPRSNFSVLGTALAGTSHMLHGALASLARALFPDTAESDELARHASWWGLTRKAAAAASGQVNFAGTNGATVPEGLVLRRADEAQFLTTESAVISEGLASVTVNAREKGSAGNTDPFTVLAVATPVNGIGATAQVSEDGLGGGAEEETDTRLRARLKSKVQAKATGGSESDFYNWVMEVAGVTRAWIYPNRLGPGTVGVTFLMDDNPTSPIPSPEDVDRVQAHLDELRPVCCQVTVFAPTAVPLDFEISLAPDTEAVREAVQAELADLILRECEPESTLLISHIREAISQATGETDHSLTAPAANVTAAAGEITTMGTVAWS